jgi:hypothetical protein
MRSALFTIPIAALKDDPSRALVGLGSGCLVNSGGRNVFVGVSHILKEDGACYAIHIRNDITKGAQFYRLDPTIAETLLSVASLRCALV